MFSPSLGEDAGPVTCHVKKIAFIGRLAWVGAIYCSSMVALYTEWYNFARIKLSGPHVPGNDDGAGTAVMGYWRYTEIDRQVRGGPIPGWLVYAIGIVAVVNFFGFVGIADYLGGDALNGHEAEGHYFLSNHGHLTEVSRAVFKYSQWHFGSLFVTHPLAILVGWICLNKPKPSQP
jgi:hypothetical protein